VSSALERLLLPAECLVCRGLLSHARADDLVCPVCRSRMRVVRPPWCARCGQPEPHFGPCRLCREWPGALRSARSAVWLEAGARSAAHALKYGGLPRIATDLAAVMVRAIPAPDATARLIPIPLGRARLRRRGYNQSLWLARALAAHWRLPVLVQLLVRTRDTATQTALTPGARQANVAGAFALQSGVLRGRGPLVLVDDVFTTGSTLAEAARALEASGFTTISAVTFGRASIPDFS
jgi:ComF family protein